MILFEFDFLCVCLNSDYLDSKLPCCTVYYGLLCMSVLMG
jgi:hypothetical protein